MASTLNRSIRDSFKVGSFPKNSVTTKGAHLSTLICSGQVSRGDALAEMERDPYPREIADADREYVIKKFGLTEESFNAIIATPPKLHESYPSNKFLYHDLHAMKQVFKRIATRV